MATKRLWASNDGSGSTAGAGASFDRKVFSLGITGAFTADATGTVFGVPTGFSGVISALSCGVAGCGVDGSNPLQVKFTVKKNGSNVCSTDGVITKAGADARADSVTGGSNVTAPVLNTDTSIVLAAGDQVTCLFDITRTASPGTEITNPWVTVVVDMYRSDPS